MIWFWFLRNFNWQIRDLSADLESLVAVSAFKIFFLVAKRTNANQPEIVERTTTHCKWAPLCAVVLAAVRCWVLFTFLVIYFYLIPKFGLFSSIFVDFRRLRGPHRIADRISVFVWSEPASGCLGVHFDVHLGVYLDVHLDGGLVTYLDVSGSTVQCLSRCISVVCDLVANRHLPTQSPSRSALQIWRAQFTFRWCNLQLQVTHRRHDFENHWRSAKCRIQFRN